MQIVMEHPEWSDAAVAREVEMSPSTLSKSRSYKKAAKLARDQGYEIRRGHYNQYTEQVAGHEEAFDENIELGNSPFCPTPLSIKTLNPRGFLLAPFNGDSTRREVCTSNTVRRHCYEDKTEARP